MIPNTPMDQVEFVRYIMSTKAPFNQLLGIEMTHLEEGHAELTIPFREQLVGDPIRPALHGGVLSALIDVCGGSAVWTLIGPNDRVSTIDLRVDYLRPAPLEDIRAVADVIRVGNRVGVATVRVFAVQSPDLVLAEGKGVYAIKRADETK